MPPQDGLVVEELGIGPEDYFVPKDEWASRKKSTAAYTGMSPAGEV